jgi:hypothetical protein
VDGSDGTFSSERLLLRSDLTAPYTGFTSADLIDEDTGDAVSPDTLADLEVIIGYYVLGSMIAFNWQFSS